MTLRDHWRHHRIQAIVYVHRSYTLLLYVVRFQCCVTTLRDSSATPFSIPMRCIMAFKRSPPKYAISYLQRKVKS